MEEQPIESENVEAVETTGGDDRGKRLQAVYSMLDSDEAYRPYVPATYDEFLGKIGKDRNYAQAIHKMVASDEVYSQYLPETFDETVTYFGLGKPTATPPSASGLASKQSGGQMPMAQQPRSGVSPSSAQTYFSPEELGAQPQMPREEVIQTQTAKVEVPTPQEIEPFKDPNVQIALRAELSKKKAAESRAESESYKGNLFGAMYNTIADGFTKTSEDVLYNVSQVMTTLYPELVEGGDQMTNEQRMAEVDTALKNLGKADPKTGERVGIKGTLDDMIKSKGTTDEFIERTKKEGGIIAEGVLGLGGSLFAMATPSQSGFFIGTFADAHKEIRKEMPDANPVAQFLYSATQGTAAMLLEKAGFSNLIQNKSVMKNLTGKIINEIKKMGVKMTPEVLESTAAKLVNGFLAEAETGGTQFLVEESIKQIADALEGEEDAFEFEGWQKFTGDFFRAAASEGVGGFVMKGLGEATSAIKSPADKQKASQDKQQVDEMMNDLSNPNVSPEAKQAISKKVDEKAEAILETYATEQSKIEGLSEEDKKEFTSLSEQATSMEAVIADPNVSDATKQAVQSDLEETNKQIETILASAKPKVEEQVLSGQGKNKALEDKANEIATALVGDDSSPYVIGRRKEILNSPSKELDRMIEFYETTVIPDIEKKKSSFFDGRKSSDLKNAKQTLEEFKKLRDEFNSLKNESSKETVGGVIEMPTSEQQFNEAKEGNTVTFEYASEAEVPDFLKDKITSKLEVNGKPSVRVTVAKSLADFYLQSEGKPTETAQEANSLANVESTRKALSDINWNETERYAKWYSKNEPIVKEYSTAESTSEAYHKAKADGSNPELVQAVEELLAPTQKATTETAQPKVTVEEIKSLPLTRIEGAGMGSNQAVGTFISTEPENRYAAQFPDKEVQSMEVDIENPFVSEDTNLIDFRNELANRRKAELDETDFTEVEVPDGNFTIDDLSDSGIEKVAGMVTEELKAKGYDSIYFPKTETQEGELVVFDRGKARKKGEAATTTEQAPTTQTAPVSEAPREQEKGEFSIQGTFNGLTQVLGSPENIIPDVQRGTVKREFSESNQNGKKIFTLRAPQLDNGGRAGYLAVSLVLPETTNKTINDVKGDLEKKLTEAQAAVDLSRNKGLPLELTFKKVGSEYVEAAPAKTTQTPTQANPLADVESTAKALGNLGKSVLEKVSNIIGETLNKKKPRIDVENNSAITSNGKQIKFRISRSTDAEIEQDFLTITAIDNNGNKIGYAKFIDNGKNNLEGSEVDVPSKYQRLGVASAIYSFADAKGYKVTESVLQTPEGRALWKSLKAKQGSLNSISEAYHADKAAGKETELTKAVEELLKPTQDAAQTGNQQQNDQQKREGIAGSEQGQQENRANQEENVTPSQAEASGGNRVAEGGTQQEVTPEQQVISGTYGSEGEVKFADGIIMSHKFKLIEADDMQPSHLVSGQRNPKHLIALAQPKERNDQGSRIQQDKIADNPRLQEVGDSPIAYTGAPIVNKRGEVIQGNNRSLGLKKHYEIGGKSYKEQLAENAEKFGLTKEQVMAMKNPVLVREIAASDQAAIVLGNYDVKDIETGGKQRIDPIVTSRKIKPSDRQKLTTLVFDGDKTVKEAIRDSAREIATIIKSYINPAQMKTAFSSSGEITASGMDDIEGIMNSFLYEDGPASLPEVFSSLPNVIQKGVQKGIPSLVSVNPEKSLLKDVQNAMTAVYEYIQSGADNFDVWSRSVDMFLGVSPQELFSPLELDLANKMLNAKKQSDIANIFKQYQANVTDQPAGLFDEAVPGLSKKDAIVKQFNLEYDETNDIKGESQDRVAPALRAEGRPVEPIAENEQDQRVAEEAKVKPQPIKEAGNEIANAVRKVKIGRPDYLQSSLGTAVWDAAVETVASSIEGGAKVAQAIQNAITQIKESEYYKSLNDSMKRKFLSDFVGSVNNSITPEIAPDYSPLLSIGEIDSSSLKSRILKGKASKAIKEMVEANGINYEVQNQELARGYANAIIDEIGLDAAVDLAARNVIKGAPKTFILGANVDAKSKNGDDTAEAMEAINLFDEALRAAGREIAAAYRVYLNSPQGLYAFEKQKIKKNVDQTLSKGQKNVNIKKTKTNVDKNGKSTAKDVAKEVTDELAGKPPREKNDGRAENVNKQKQEAAQKKKAAALSKLKANRPLTSGGLSPEFIEGLVELGAANIELGYYKVEAWLRQMKKDLKSAGIDNISDEDILSVLDQKGESGKSFAEEMEIAKWESAAEQLAAKIHSLTKEPTKGYDPVKVLINGLYQKVAEKVKTEKKKPLSDLEKAKVLVKNYENAKSVWEQAKEIELDNINAMQISSEEKAALVDKLWNFFDEVIGFPFSEKTTEKLISKELQDRAKDNKNVTNVIEGILADSFVYGVDSKQGMIDNIVRKLEVEANISASDAKKIAQKFADKFEERMAKETEAFLNKQFKPKPLENQVKRQQQHKAIVREIIWGALDNQKFKQAFYDKYGFDYMNDPKFDQALKDLTAEVYKAPEGFLRDEAMSNLAAFVRIAEHGYNYWAIPNSLIVDNLLFGTETFIKATDSNTVNSIAMLGQMIAKDPKNAKFIVEKLFAAKGKKDAMSIGLRQMGFWMGLRGMKQRDEAANVDISKLLAENHPNKAMRGLGYWMQKSGRVLTSIDYATSIPAKYTKFADLMLSDIKARNSKLPKSEQMSQKQMEAIVNEILGETTDAVEAAMEQAEKDIATMYPKEKIDTKAKIPNKATVAYKARVFEILEQGREKRAGEVKEKVDWMADFTEEELDVYEKYADKYADKVSLMGTPNGTLGLVALAMKSIGTQFPGLRFIQAAPWFINAPLNLANLLYDSVPIVGLTRAGSFMLKGRRGALASDEAAQKLGFFTREQNERIYLEQRNALLKRVVALQVASWSMLALSGFFDDDEEKEKFESKEDYIKSKPFYMTGSLSVNPEKAAAIEKAYNVKPYTFYVDGKDVLSFKNNALIAVLGLAGNTLDSRNFGNREDEEMLASYVNGVGSTIAYINETSATRGIADAIAAYMGIGKYEGATGSQYDRVVRSLAKNSASSIQAMFLPRVVPSMYKDIQGALQYDKKKATSFSEFLVNDVPFLEEMIVTKQIDHFGRPIKEEFFMPSPFGGLSLVGWENGVFTGPLKEIQSQDKYYKMAVDVGYMPSAYKETKYFAEVSPLDYMGKETDKMKGFRGTVKEQGKDEDLKQNEKGMYVFQLDISPEKLAEINVVRGTYVREWLDKNEQIFMTKSKADRKKILENLFSTGTSLAKGKVLNLENEVYRFVPVPAGTSGFEVAGVNIPTKLND